MPKRSAQSERIAQLQAKRKQFEAAGDTEGVARVDLKLQQAAEAEERLAAKAVAVKPAKTKREEKRKNR